MRGISALVGSFAALAMAFGATLHMATEPEALAAPAKPATLRVVPMKAEREQQPPPTPEALLKSLAEVVVPGPEHEKLERFVGEWNFTARLWTNPDQPPAEVSGVMERKWIMEGLFVQETARGVCPRSGRTIEIMGLLGFDASQRKYTWMGVNGLSGAIFSDLLECDPAGLRFSGVKEECWPRTDRKVLCSDEFEIENDDKIVFSQYRMLYNRQVKVIEVESTRRQ